MAQISGDALAKFEYIHDAAGQILTWRQQVGSSSTVEWRYEYDAAGQLVDATKWSAGTVPAVLARYRYAYDAAGNRTTEQIDDSIVESLYNELNRLVEQRPGGIIRVAGAVNEPATVAVQGKRADVDAGGRFRGTASTTSGTNTFAVTATDPSGNTASRNYEVDQAGVDRVLSYDANGNLTAGFGWTFGWDAANRMVATTSGDSLTTLSYSGDFGLHRIRTTNGSVTTKDRTLIWCGRAICKSRESSSADYYFERGYLRGAETELVVKDHLQSVVAVTDMTGAGLATFSYTPFGVRAQTSGTASRVPFGFTGHLTDDELGLVITLLRAYDPRVGRWLSQDPLGLAGGPNTYTYVENRPINRFDPFGLQTSCRNCTPEQQSQAQQGARSVCRNVVSNQRCRDVLHQNKMYQCYQERACGVRPYTMTCDQNPPRPTCGSTSVAGGGITLTFNAFVPAGSCGAVQNTIAHELAHVCGIGGDDTTGNPGWTPFEENLKRANEVGLACGDGR